MNTTKQVEGIDRTLTRFRAIAAAAHIQRHVQYHADDLNPTAPPGDERRLRGIPVVGARGVGGAIAGTVPHSVR